MLWVLIRIPSAKQNYPLIITKYPPYLFFCNLICFSVILTYLFLAFQDLLIMCWAYKPTDRPTFSHLLKVMEWLPKISEEPLPPHSSVVTQCGLPTHFIIFEPEHLKTNKMTCAPSKDSDQTGPISLGMCPVWSVVGISMKKHLASMKKHWGLSYPLSA